MATLSSLYQFEAIATPRNAHLNVDVRRRAEVPVSPLLLGKFCEHLGSNIYHGMEAQILFNPTFSKWRFSAGNHPDGGVREESDPEAIRRRIEALVSRMEFPEAAPLREAYFNGCAYGWFHVDSPRTVRFSPDAGPHGERAQRVEVLEASDEAPQGIGQWTFLPLHRTRGFEFRMVARAVEPTSLLLTLAPADGSHAPVVEVISLTSDWTTLTGTVRLPESWPADALYRFALLSPQPAHFVLDRMLLYPDDHVQGADPDVVRFLKDSHLPLLRWPGGNFVSGYHWRNGVGPVDARRTLPNPAWEGMEYHLFGTDEFLAFCQAVGCEPLICINAGDGTPEEAAAWVEYCNGSPDTPMGRLRAQNGHPEPYGVHYWEIGNEVYGRWQVGWTTPEGYLDRYRRFREAMLRVDPNIAILACGFGNEPDSPWNRLLIEKGGESVRILTDHILTGGSVDADTDPVELTHAFLGYATVLEDRYRALQERMRQAGIPDPRLAITELQLFAHFRGEVKPDGKLTPTTMPRQDSITEALYYATIVNLGIRLGDFVALITHSATVNHGGGLRKRRERVYANPVYYARALAHALAGGTPVATQLRCATYATHRAFAHIPPLADVPLLDSMAVLQEPDTLVLWVVHRGADTGPVELCLTLEGFRAEPTAVLDTLAGDTWYDGNTLQEPERVIPRRSEASVHGNTLIWELPPFSLTRITLKGSCV